MPGLYPAKNRYNALWTNGRARGVRFFLDFTIYLCLAPNAPGMPVFGGCPSDIFQVPLTLSPVTGRRLDNTTFSLECRCDRRDLKQPSLCCPFNHMFHAAADVCV